MSEKKEAFCLLQPHRLFLSESICLIDHEKQIQKFVAHWKAKKSSQREVIKKNAYEVPEPHRLCFSCMHAKNGDAAVV